MKIEGQCVNCNRNNTIAELTKHHLIPKIKGGKDKDTVILCNDCHVYLNTQFTENEQRDTLNTKEKLVNNKQMSKFARFARKQKKTVKQRDSKRRNKKRPK